ncbi:Zinc finger protein Noc, partial [Stegodyphus mimosarum]
MHNAQLSSCPSGCTQCTHDRLSTSLPGLGHMPGLTGSAAAMAAVAAAGGMPGLSYPHSVLARPNVCSWMIGDTYCGKRFSTSEELLQHLRTHTNLSTSESPLSLISPAFSLASSSLNAACHMHYSSGASLTSPAGLRRTYPTSLSPVSSLSAASRYHPYKPTLSSLQGTPLSQLGHPGLGMYYPYNLYGQRLGPPVHP